MKTYLIALVALIATACASAPADINARRSADRKVEQTLKDYQRELSAWQ